MNFDPAARRWPGGGGGPGLLGPPLQQPPSAFGFAGAPPNPGPISPPIYQQPPGTDPQFFGGGWSGGPGRTLINPGPTYAPPTASVDGYAKPIGLQGGPTWQPRAWPLPQPHPMMSNQFAQRRAQPFQQGGFPDWLMKAIQAHRAVQPQTGTGGGFMAPGGLPQQNMGWGG